MLSSYSFTGIRNTGMRHTGMRHTHQGVPRIQYSEDRIAFIIILIHACTDCCNRGPTIL